MVVDSFLTGVTETVAGFKGSGLSISVSMDNSGKESCSPSSAEQSGQNIIRQRIKANTIDCC